MTDKPIIFVTEMPHKRFKIRSKGAGGTFLYKTAEEMNRLISWNDYEVVYVGEMKDHWCKMGKNCQVREMEEELDRQ